MQRAAVKHMSRKHIGRIPVSTYNQNNQLPFDVDGKCICEVPINTEKRLDSAKDGRYWGTLGENKKKWFYWRSIYCFLPRFF